MSERSGATVLAIDDEPDLLDLAIVVLGDEGYVVETARDGREALAMVDRRMPDLILLDMKMPVMDGWQFAREFRARYDDQAPIVVLTAAADARRRAEEIGAVGWLGKPFDVDDLARIVARFIRRPSP